MVFKYWLNSVAIAAAGTVHQWDCEHKDLLQCKFPILGEEEILLIAAACTDFAII